MNTNITRWLLMCTFVISSVFSYELKDLMDPDFQPFEDRKIDKWERLRMIDELKEAQNSVPTESESEEINSNEAKLLKEKQALKAEKQKAEKALMLKKEEESRRLQEHENLPLHIPSENEEKEELIEFIPIENNQDKIDVKILEELEEKERFNIEYENQINNEKASRMQALQDEKDARILEELEEKERFDKEYRMDAISSDKPASDNGDYYERPYINPDFLPTDSRAAVTVTIRAGGYGGENTWTLQSADGTTVASGGPYSNCGLDVIELDLADGDYSFLPVDDYNDGWNCTYCDLENNVYDYYNGSYTCGSYLIEDANGNQLLSGGHSSSENGTSYTFNVNSSAVFGCTSATACNYDSAATNDDSSCIEPNACNACPDADGNVDISCYGCTDSDALNYDENATASDGSCVYPGATCDAPVQLDLPLTLSGNTAGFGDDYSLSPCSTSYMRGDDWIGSFTLDAQTFVNASVSGSWTGVHITSDCVDVATECLGFGGSSSGSSTGDVLLEAGTYLITVSTYASPQSSAFDLTITTTVPVSGCDDPNADNYNAEVNNPCSDGPDADNVPDCCIFLQATGCTDETALNYDADAELDDNSCTYSGAVCEAPINLTLPASIVGANNGSVDFDGDGTSDFAYGDDYSSSPCSSNYMGGDDVVYSLTLTEQSLLSVDLSGTWIGAHITSDCVDVATECLGFVGSSSGGSASNILLEAGTYLLTVSTYPSPQATSFDLSVSAAATIAGCADSFADNYSADVNLPCQDGDDEDTYPDCCEYTAVLGCTDSTACNFDDTADTDDGTCEMPNECGACPDYANGQYDVGESFTDILYGNGVYDDGETFTDLGNGQYDVGEPFVDTCTDTNFDSDGTVLTDGSDGCADYSSAWCGDYDTDTFDSGTMCCICGGGNVLSPDVWEEGESYTDLGNDVWDEGEDFVDALYGNDEWDEGEAYVDVTTPADNSCLGCTDATACNYDPDATIDDNSCAAFGGVAQNIPCSCPSDDGISTAGGSYSFGNYATLCSDPDGFGASFSTEILSGSYFFANGSIHGPDESCVDASAGTAFYPTGGWSSANSVTAELEAGECITFRVYDYYGYAYYYGSPSAQGVLNENPDPNAIGGCTDSSANNYSELAQYDDGSCLYPGATCEDAYQIPGLPFEFSGTTAGYADDYSSSVCYGNYIGGDDWVARLTLDEDVILTGSISGSWIGLHITSDCIDTASVCTGVAASSSGGSTGGILVSAGSYYLTVSTYPAPQSSSFDLSLSAVPAAYGCTDSNATNYDDTANIACSEDGVENSCCEYPANCTDYLVTMGDTYGDGWNGNILNIGGTELTGPPSGCESDDYYDPCTSSATLCLVEGVYDVTMGGGSFVGETFWSIALASDPGNTLLSGTYESLSAGCLDISETEDCPVAGCMLAGAPNFNAEASIDDGSCEFFTGAVFDYWVPGGSTTFGAPYTECYLGCSTNYFFCDCEDESGNSVACGTDADGNFLGDGIPDAIGNGDCDSDGDLFCAEFNYDATPEGECDCDLIQTTDETSPCYEIPVLGCTDPNAINTSEEANVNCTEQLAESTGCEVCDFGCVGDTPYSYTLYLGDTYGDGWNGATMTLGDYTFTGPLSGCESDCYDGLFNINDECADGIGPCWHVHEICLGAGDVSIVAGGGSFDSEIEWYIIDENEGTYWDGYEVASGNATSGTTFTAPVPEYTCGDGTCNDASYTDVDGNAGTEGCGVADDATACFVDCGQCPWDTDAPVLSSTGTYYTLDGVSYPSILFEWNLIEEGYSCEDIIADPSLDACYTYSLAGNTCEYLTSLDYDCALVQECSLCYVQTACEVAGGNESWVNDGYCDGVNNNNACGFDGGDCCASSNPSCATSSFYPCNCDDPSSEEGLLAACDANGGFFCGADPSNWTVYSPNGCTSYTCDGYSDCADGSDEADANEGDPCYTAFTCGDGVCDTALGEAAGDSGCYADCGCLDGEFDCGASGSVYGNYYGNCIASSWTCEGFSDCADGSDESDDLCIVGLFSDSDSPIDKGYNPTDEDMMLIRSVFGFTDYPKSSPDQYGGTWTDLAHRKLKAASMNNMPSPSVTNLDTGVTTPGDAASNRAVSYTLKYTSANGSSTEINTQSLSHLLYISTDLASYCAEVRAQNSDGEVTPWSNTSCNQTGFSNLNDCSGNLISESWSSWLGDGVCDSLFACGDFNCDEGDCLDACGVCSGPGAQTECWDGSLACDLDSCPAEPASCVAGDLNGDDTVNVLDVVALVAVVLAAGYDECGDLNSDNETNVLDVVAQVAIVLAGGNARIDDASSAVMTVQGNTLNVLGNGYIGAVQLTLEHNSDFSLELTDDAMVADYVTNDNITTLIVVAPENSEIFTASGEYDIIDVVAANSSTYVDVIEVGSFALKSAYPNPFNPSTSLSLDMPMSGYVSVKAYNLIGQVVGVIAEGSIDAGVHTFTWDASNLSSGVYLITAEYAGNLSTQKVMLMK